MGPTIRDCWVIWAAAHGHLASFATEEGRWRLELGPVFGDLEAGTLSPLDVDAYRARRARAITRRGRPPGPATVNREVVLLNRVLNFAVSRRAVPANPIRGAVKLLPEPPPPDAVVDEDGIDRMTTIMAKGPTFCWREALAWMVVAFTSGMRRSEVWKLCWRQLDFKLGLIYIPGAHTKTRKARVVEFPAWAQPFVLALPRNGDRVFRSHPRWLYGIFARSVKLAGIVGMNGNPPTWHALRRSYITLMRRRGVEETVVMKLSGHKDRSVFDRYNVVSGGDILEAIRKNADGRARELEELRSTTRRAPKYAPPTSLAQKFLREARA